MTFSLARGSFGALVLAAAMACKGGGPPAATHSAESVRDTASLSAEALRISQFATAPATVAPWSDGWNVPARIILDPALTQPLGAIAEGRITGVLVRVGDRVRKGQVLVRLHSHEMMDAQSDLSKAQAAQDEAASALALATSAAERAERLYSIKAYSLADLERARAARTQAAAALSQARAERTRATGMLEHLTGTEAGSGGADGHEVLVRAPIDGVVVAREAQPGAVVLVGAPLLTVSQPTALLLVMALPERAMGAAGINGTIHFTVPAYPAEKFEARIARISPTLDSTSRTIEVQARIVNGADRLRAEMFASAELLGAPGAPVLSVPTSAVQAMEGDTVVITGKQVGTGMLIEAVPVRVGRRTSERSEIVAGITAGTPVIARNAAIARADLLRRREER
jgi:cobalt-zinc-cadmium efflux system membrane fusion protein